MYFFNTTAKALFFSASLHAALCFSYSPSSSLGKGGEGPSVQVDLVRGSQPDVPPALSSPVKRQGIAIPRVRAGEKKAADAAQEQRRSFLRKEVAEEIEKFRSASSSRSAQSEDLASDPVMGKVFVEYFSQVKKIIHDRLRKDGGAGTPKHGVVQLVFVLGRDGSLLSAKAQGSQSGVDTSLKSRAVDALRRSAPFGPFPPSLDFQEIAFNLNIRF